MISVSEALDHIFTLVRPLDPEDIPIAQASGRTLIRPAVATRDQPPFRTSVMDGYAVRAEDAEPGAVLDIVGEAAAGHATAQTVGPAQAIRIFTGAPVPKGAARVVIQEDVSRDGNRITITDSADPGPYIRPAGADFHAGDALPAPATLTPALLTLAASMNLATLSCARRPEVAILATGDELVLPGGTPGPDQIIASNGFGLAAMIENAGGIPRRLPIAADRPAALDTAFELAQGADLIVSIGGASVGDHDLVRAAAAQRGLEPSFYRVAMRPGKPLMAGRIGETPMIGLPGNPVSAMVCGQVFVVPALRVMLGHAPCPAPRLRAPLATPLERNGAREHYMRASLSADGLSAFERQDSGLIRILSQADALLVRPPNDPARAAGEIMDYLPLPRAH